MSLGRQFASGLAVRVARYPLQAAFVLLVPPVLGAETYGAYAACVALFAILVEATELGTIPLFGRLAPSLPPEGVRLLARQVLWSRLLLALGPGALLLALLWTPRPEDPLLFALVLAAVLVTCVQQVLFGRLYARGEIVRVMARDPLRSGLSLALVLPGYLAFGLVGAVGALVAAQVVLSAVAAVWARPAPRDLAPPQTLKGLPAALRFGLASALPVVLLTVAIKAGTPLLSRLGRPSAEVGTFDLATQAFALGLALLAYPFAALLPALGQRVDGGKAETAQGLLERVVARTGAAALAGVALASLVGGPAIHLVFGEGFAGLFPLVLVVAGVGVFPALAAQAGLTRLLLDRRPEAAILPAGLLAALTVAVTLAAGARYGAAAGAAGLLAGLLAQVVALAWATPGFAPLVGRRVGSPALLALLPVGATALDASRLLAVPLDVRAGTALLALAAAGLLLWRGR